MHDQAENQSRNGGGDDGRPGIGPRAPLSCSPRQSYPPDLRIHSGRMLLDRPLRHDWRRFCSRIIICGPCWWKLPRSRRGQSREHSFPSGRIQLPFSLCIRATGVPDSFQLRKGAVRCRGRVSWAAAVANWGVYAVCRQTSCRNSVGCMTRGFDQAIGVDNPATALTFYLQLAVVIVGQT